MTEPDSTRVVSSLRDLNDGELSLFVMTSGNVFRDLEHENQRVASVFHALAVCGADEADRRTRLNDQARRQVDSIFGGDETGGIWDGTPPSWEGNG